MFQVLCAATKFAQKIDEFALKPEFWLNWITMHMRHYGVKDFLKLNVKSSWNTAENAALKRGLNAAEMRLKTRRWNVA